MRKEVVEEVLALRFSTEFDLNETRAYFRALLAFRPAIVPSNPLFALHFILGQVLIALIPFSKVMHMPGVFLSKSLIFLK